MPAAAPFALSASALERGVPMTTAGENPRSKDETMRSVRVWLKGLLAAVIGGGSNALTAAFVDAEHFNPLQGGGWKHFGEMALAGAVITAAHFLATSPLPGGRLERVRRVARAPVAARRPSGRRAGA